MTEQARVYQLVHRHQFTAVLRPEAGAPCYFRYGIKTSTRKAKTTVVHGLTGSQSEYEIETVAKVDVKVGDTLELSHTNRKTKVTFVEAAVMDETQLLFVPYEQADKVLTIGIRNLEE